MSIFKTAHKPTALAIYPMQCMVKKQQQQQQKTREEEEEEKKLIKTRLKRNWLSTTLHADFKYSKHNIWRA